MIVNYKYFSRTFSPHYRPNFILAYPVIISQAGQMVVGLTDTIMVGQLGANSLAAVSLANNIFLIGLVFGLGIAAGITPLAGKDFAGGNRLSATQWFKNGIIMLPAIGIVQALLMVFVIFLMPFMGQPPEVVKLAIPYFLALTASYIPFMFFVVFQRYAEGLGNTRIAMVITISINILNIILNYLLIYGKFGFPAWGVLGAGVATFIARLFLVSMLLLARFNRINHKT